MAQRSCQFPGCSNPTHARGLCSAHYGQLWRKGYLSPLVWRNPRRCRSINVSELRDDLWDAQDKLRIAEKCYESVMGVQDRLRWRREVAALKAEVAVLQRRLAWQCEEQASRADSEAANG